VIDWAERDGPPVETSGRRGFGLTLIEPEVSHGLGGTARLEFAPAGLRANLRISLVGK
jgi:two-component sensor histidine kinase